MATFANAWDETIPLDDSTSGLSEAGKIDDLIRQLKLDIRERLNKFMPVGMVIKWTSTIVPYGFKVCNGASLSRTTYAGLFAVIGTTYGYADAATFKIPDYRGRFLRGWNHSKASGLYDPDAASRTDRGDGTTGDHVGTEQDDENKNHRHTYITGGTGRSAYGVMPAHSGAITFDDTGEDARPENIYFRYIIRVDDNNSDGTYNYTRVWNELTPMGTNYMGRMALEIRKLKKDVQELFDNMFPVGMVIYWPGDSAPEGYLELNGQEVSKTTYPSLYDLWDDYFGVPASDDNFKLPNCRGLFIRAQDEGAGVDGYSSSRTGGDVIGSTQGDSTKSHGHGSITGITSGMGNAYGGGVSAISCWSIQNENSSNSPTRTVDGHPKNINLMAIVKAVACV